MIGVRVPQRGEIWRIDPNPAKGQEQQEKRPWVILSDGAFNRHGIVIAVCVTNGAEKLDARGLTVQISGCKTTGVAVISQVRAFDFRARDIEFLDRLPDKITTDIGERVASLVDPPR